MSIWQRIVVVVIAILAFQFVSTITPVQAGKNIYYYGTQFVEGKMYHIYLQEYGRKAELWFRVKQNACSYGDVKALTIISKKQKIDPKKTLVDAAKKLCEVKGIYDNGKTVVGCASTGVTGICLAASVPSAGASAALCSASIAYTINRGFADCISGVTGWIAQSLASDSDWAVIAMQVSISTGQWGNAISYAINLACERVK